MQLLDFPLPRIHAIRAGFQSKMVWRPNELQALDRTDQNVRIRSGRDCRRHYRSPVHYNPPLLSLLPAARFRIGLYRHGDLAGVAVFSHPCSNAVLTNVFQAPLLSTVELGRFLLLDFVGGNGETWFLARAFEILRSRGIVGVVSFSDLRYRAAKETMNSLSSAGSSSIWTEICNGD